MAIRQSQFDSILRREVSSYTESINFENLGVVSVSYVKSVQDLSRCYVGLQVFPRNDILLKKYIEILNLKKSKFQLKISRQHNFNKIPIISFEIDTDIEKTDNLNNLIRNLQNARS